MKAHGLVEVTFSYPMDINDVVKSAIGEYCFPRRSSNLFSFMFAHYNAEASKGFVPFVNIIVILILIGVYLVY